MYNHATYTICVINCFMLSLRLLINNRILVIKFWRGTKVTGRFLTIQEAGTPKPQVLQDSTIFSKFSMLNVFFVNELFVETFC